VEGVPSDPANSIANGQDHYATDPSRSWFTTGSAHAQIPHPLPDPPAEAFAESDLYFSEA
jgi:hypothetical protein